MTHDIGQECAIYLCVDPRNLVCPMEQQPRSTAQKCDARVGMWNTESSEAKRASRSNSLVRWYHHRYGDMANIDKEIT